VIRYSRTAEYQSLQAPTASIGLLLLLAGFLTLSAVSSLAIAVVQGGKAVLHKELKTSGEFWLFFVIFVGVLGAIFLSPISQIWYGAALVAPMVPLLLAAIRYSTFKVSLMVVVASM